MPSMLANIVGLALLLNIHGAFAAGPSPVLLGTAGNFAILAKTGVSTVPDSVVGGNVGVSPATISSVTGFSLVQDVSTQFWTSTQVNGRVMGATDGLPTPGLLTVAVLDMQTAFTDAMNRPAPDFIELKAGLIGGSILTPGLYKWTTGVSISTDISIAGGPADSTLGYSKSREPWSRLRTSTITLVGGALSQNIVWVVGNTVTVGANGVFEGNILAQTDVVIGTSAIDHGCIYAQTDVALEKATVFEFVDSSDLHPGKLFDPPELPTRDLVSTAYLRSSELDTPRHYNIHPHQ
ncbi:antifreeze protein [Mycena olivaceomarginata]|nr:antifreeze protein [Mycena olivaceomarginata]